MSYITNNSLKVILGKIKENFFSKDEAEKFCGYNTATLSATNNNISINTSKLTSINYIYNLGSPNNSTNIEFSSITGNYTRVNYFYGKDSTPKFTFPNTYNINFPEDLFKLYESNGNKILEARGQLDYYILKITLANGNIFVDIEAKVSPTNYYIQVKLNNNNTEKPFVNMGWYYRNKNYINSIQYTTKDNPGINDWVEYRGIENDNGIVSSNWKYVKIYLCKNCKSLSQMFKNCRISLLDLSCKPDAITDFSYMCQDSNLKGFLNYGTFINMPDYVNCTGMFKNCSFLKGINKVNQKDWVNNYATWIENNMTEFINIQDVILRINWGKDPIWDSMFEGCPYLLFVDMSDWVIQKDSKISAEKMFYNSFKHMYFGSSTKPNNYEYINYVKFPLDPDKTPYITSNKDIFIGCDYLNNIVAPFELSENYETDATINTHKVFESLTKDDLGYYTLSRVMTEMEMNGVVVHPGAITLKRENVSMAGIKHDRRSLYINVESSNIELNTPSKAWEVMTAGGDLYL